MVDKLAKTTIQDLAFATALGIDMKEVEELSIHQQRIEMQHIAFNLQSNKTDITQDEADTLNEMYQDIVSILENEYGVDLSCDYMINFDSFVPGNDYYSRFAY